MRSSSKRRGRSSRWGAARRSGRSRTDGMPASCRGAAIRVTAAAPGARPPAAGGTGRGTGGGGAAAATTLNYPLYQALGADFAVAVLPASGDSTIVTVHDVAAGGVRRELRVHLPALKDPAFRLAVHQLADRVLEAQRGAGGTAATG